jgi:hypothetical protein
MSCFHIELDLIPIPTRVITHFTPRLPCTYLETRRQNAFPQPPTQIPGETSNYKQYTLKEKNRAQTKWELLHN